MSCRENDELLFLHSSIDLPVPIRSSETTRYPFRPRRGKEVGAADSADVCIAESYPLFG